MSEEYVMLQYDNEQLKKDVLHWIKLATEAQAALDNTRNENEQHKETIRTLISENEEYRRTNERIWETTKIWIKEDSEIISKQAAQIRFLVDKIKALEKKNEDIVV